MSKHHHRDKCQCGGKYKGDCHCASKKETTEGLFGENGGTLVLALIFVFLIFGWIGGNVF